MISIRYAHHMVKPVESRQMQYLIANGFMFLHHLTDIADTREFRGVLRENYWAYCRNCNYYRMSPNKDVCHYCLIPWAIKPFAKVFMFGGEIIGTESFTYDYANNIL